MTQLVLKCAAHHDPVLRREALLALAEMQVDAPFSRLREFDGFLTLHDGAMKMALAPDVGEDGSTRGDLALARNES